MPGHTCDKNGYVGIERGEIAGFFGLFRALLVAKIKAILRSQAIYERDCPSNCDDRKDGLTSFKVIESRLTKVPVSPPPGVRQRLGWLVRVQWRLWVYCGFTDVEELKVVKRAPSILPWRDLEDFLAEVYDEKNLDQIDKHLKRIGSGQ